MVFHFLSNHEHHRSLERCLIPYNSKRQQSLLVRMGGIPHLEVMLLRIVFGFVGPNIFEIVLCESIWISLLACCSLMNFESFLSDLMGTFSSDALSS
jgi:hypothetical protein